MFTFHFHARFPLDVQCHVLLTAAIYGCFVFSILEALDDRQVLFTYGRCLFVALQGTWRYQAAFILYYPYAWPPNMRWNLHDHGLIADVTFDFCLHVMGLLVALIFLHVFIHWLIVGRNRRRCRRLGQCSRPIEFRKSLEKMMWLQRKRLNEDIEVVYNKCECEVME
jgi:hypothetical protein